MINYSIDYKLKNTANKITILGQMHAYYCYNFSVESEWRHMSAPWTSMILMQLRHGRRVIYYVQL